MLKPSISRFDSESDADWNRRYHREYYRLQREAKGASVKPQSGTPVVSLDQVDGETDQERKLRYNRAYYELNRETIKRWTAAYREANKDAVLATAKAKYKRERAKIRKAQAEYQKRTEDAISARNKRWRAENKEWLAAYEEANKERIEARMAAYRAKNAERYKKLHAAWSAKNPANNRARAWKRKFRITRACPAWADLKAIADVYRESVRLQALTGVKHHVDHIVPIKGKTVCGLHVHWNLRPIPAAENMRKKNRLIECLLQPPRQLSLSP